MRRWRDVDLGTWPGSMSRGVAWAVATLGLLAAYHGLRYIAARCTGPGCDAFIPLSLFLPLSTWVAAVITGVVAAVEARGAAWATWPALVAVSIGVPASALVWRDSPDQLVLVGSVLLALAPVAAIGAALASKRAARPG